MHLTDGTGSAKDEHLVPGRGTQPAAELFLGHLAATRLRRPHRAGDQHPQGATRARSASATWPSRWPSPASTSWSDRAMSTRRAAGRVGGRARPTPGPRSSTRRASRSPPRASAGTTIRGGRRAGRGRPGAGAPLLRHQGRPVPRRARDPDRPARVIVAPVMAGGPDGAGERFLTVFLSVWDDPAVRPSLIAVVRGGDGPGRAPAAQRRLPAGGARAGRRRPSASTGPSCGCRWSPPR